MPRKQANTLSLLEQHIEVPRKLYEAHLDTVAHNLKIEGLNVTLRLHYVRFDANGEPKFNDLASCLANHVIEYCLSICRRGTPSSPSDWTRLAREASSMFRKHPTSGEAGEMLLYFLLESVIGAPQVVAKMSLKTARNMEVHGCDGIHMKWHEKDCCLDVYFGEAKLEQTIGKALSNAFASIKAFHDNGGMAHEFSLVLG